MLSTCVPIGHRQKQLNVTLNFPTEKNPPLRCGLLSKFFDHLLLLFIRSHVSGLLCGRSPVLLLACICQAAAFSCIDNSNHYHYLFELQNCLNPISTCDTDDRHYFCREGLFHAGNELYTARKSCSRISRCYVMIYIIADD